MLCDLTRFLASKPKYARIPLNNQEHSLHVFGTEDYVGSSWIRIQHRRLRTCHPLQNTACITVLLSDELHSYLVFRGRKAAGSLIVTKRPGHEITWGHHKHEVIFLTWMCHPDTVSIIWFAILSLQRSYPIHQWTLGGQWRSVVVANL